MANALYNSFKQKIMDGSIDLDTDTIKCALLTSGYTYDATALDNHEDWADLSAYEISTTGYTAGGCTLTAAAVSKDTTNNRGVFDASDAVWTSISTATAYYAIVYKSVATAASSWLIAIIDTTTGAPLPVTLNGGDFTIQWAASGSGGILYIA